MSDESRVWIMKRKTKRGTTYHLRWVCPQSHKWKARKAGTDKKHAERQAAVLEEELRRGTYRDIRHIGWNEFVSEHLAHIQGKANRKEARRALTEFGAVHCLSDLRRVTFADIEIYVDSLRETGNSTATRNKKLRYLRGAFNLAVRRDYLAKSPMTGWLWEKPKKKSHRILTADEETNLLASAEKLYGFKMVTFVRFFLATWARVSEATDLRWVDVDFDNSWVTFRDTKSKEDRVVPIAAKSGVLRDLRRLKVQTLQDGGPFVSGNSRLCEKWARMLKDAGIPYISRHDLRRTGITRALLNNMPPVTVQKMAGHANIATTMEYYCQVSQRDLRDAVDKYYREASAG